VRFEVSIRVHASADEVAAVLNDPEAAPRWESDLQRMEVVRGGANEVGSLARLHYVENGRAYTMDDELLECDANRRWRSRVSGNGMSILTETTLVERGGETEVRLVWDGGPDAWLGRVVLPLLKPAIRRRARRDLEALKRLIETGA
jgi:hypothetical protein